MAGLSAQRAITPMVSFPKWYPAISGGGLPLEASTKVYAGGVICRNAAGNVVPASAALGLMPLGLATTTVDNSGGVAGALSVMPVMGAFALDNSAAADAIGASNIGNECFLVDDHTVALTSGNGTRSRAGIVVGYDSGANQVYVLLAFGDGSPTVQPADLPTQIGVARTARAVSTSNIASLSGTTTVDGVALAAGDRVLLVAQTTASQNGIWVVQSGAWTRPSDWQTGLVMMGMLVDVGSEGTTWQNSVWKITTSAAITVDTTSVTLYPRWQKLTGTLVAGAVTFNTCWLYSASPGVSVCDPNVVTGGGTQGILGCPSANRTAGAGNGSVKVQSSSGTDTSTVELTITNF